MKRIGVGLIGFGIGGRIFHEPFIDSLEEFELCKVFTSNVEAIATLEAKYGGGIATQDMGDIMDNDLIELVVIATPNVEHFPLASQALIKGKHVLVEKPFTVDSQQALDLIALAEAHKRILTVNHNRRFDSDFSTLNQVLKQGLLGRVVNYEAHFDRYRPEIKARSWREEEAPGAGLVFDLGSHLIDQALSLFGMPTEVFAHLNMERDGARAIDSFDILLKYPSTTARLKAGMLVRAPGPRYVVHGTLGTFTKFGMDVQEASLKAGQKPYASASWGVEPQDQWGQIETSLVSEAPTSPLHFVGAVESERGDYGLLYKNVYGAIRGTEPLMVTPQEAYNVIRIIELAYMSHMQKAWVAV